MVAERVGTGAGSWGRKAHANVPRLVVGVLESALAAPLEPACVFEANVDDLDPRLWSAPSEPRLEAGADDAWLTPIKMKKGRPAHTVSGLCPPDLADAVGGVRLTRTSTFGLRGRAI